MDREKRDLIRSRALRIAPFLADYLQNEDPTDWEKGQAYRFCYLLLKGPRAFLNQFRFGDLRLCEEAIQSVYWTLRGEFPGPAELLEAERVILRDHNLAAAEYHARQDRPLASTASQERGFVLAR